MFQPGCLPPPGRLPWRIFENRPMRAAGAVSGGLAEDFGGHPVCGGPGAPASAAAARMAPRCACCRMGAASIRRSGPGGTGGAERHAGSDSEDAIRFRETRVVLATAHLDHNPRNNRRRNLRALCQRCHLIHDRPRHLHQRWIGPRSGPMCRKASAALTCRRRYALGDLFLGLYAELSRAVAGARIEAKASAVL